MNTTEVSALVAVCASFDNRKPSVEMVQAWTAAIGDLDFPAARDAVVGHYQDTTDWIMPAHIRRRVRSARASRIEDEVFHPPAELDPDDVAAYIRWLETERRAVGDGAAPTAPPVGEFRDVRELGVGRTNTLPTEQVAGHAERARAAIREQVATVPTNPEPAPLTTPADRLVERAATSTEGAL